MSLAFAVFKEKSRLKALLDHFSIIDDPREPWRVAHPLREVLLLVVCASMADCDHFDAIASWGKANIGFLRRYLPYEHGVPGGRWLTLLMNRVDPALFSAAFTGWVRETWPERPELIAIDGKTSRRSHDRAEDKAPLHLVSAFATTSRLVLGQEAVEGKSNELSAIPVLLDRLSEGGSLKGALVSIDAIATNARIAQAIVDKGADYLLAVKANQPTLRAEIESAFSAATRIDTCVDFDKGHGRIEQRSVSVITEIDWLNGERRFPGELRLPNAATIIRVKSQAELADRGRFETRYYISSALLPAKRAGEAVRGHWGIENQLHWVLDVVFAEDQSRLRKGHGARNMAVVRHFAINMIRTAPEPENKPMKPQRKATKPTRTSIKLRRKIASWREDYLAIALEASAR
ncbi:ISAs1 family transposase [Methylosinus trichosporium]|uniref:ISAs1 family transposase n=1 Tax=Methylosinus trichosporium (strain ATCC 35070 / NCIMB 11131 / UNIQEM 75 / OB3b) TaxID=595536 RepID=A0A2D2D505_METT3|nr:ISAs1 family transposase [Methylosinus trichosporium]ATQ66558.1 ISAs1 family transposase [Methylosinus trichosporium OB3b]ATQ67699.1 ISAs1 family transposase [Methylosinus trichosporium OB3b]ATQ68538.1 ISAs1 family transposase [Methylosinus trichosporium OB3b]ATQ68959.1 ISAs1 family transposase [Methylosinus trichosporium OB3b]ATQ70090.1 ISAs1 family transposase [Methylosinus trichosporium OB3b]